MDESRAISRAPAVFAQREIRRDHRAVRRDGGQPSLTPALSALEVGLQQLNARTEALQRRIAACPVPSSSPLLASPGLAPSPIHPQFRRFPAPAQLLTTPRPFDVLEPAWEQDLDAPAVDDVDQKILYEFWDALEQENLESCERCKERWFDRRLSNGICFQCRNKDKNRDQDEPFFFSEDNHLDFGPGPAQYGLPELSMAEEMLIARVHVAIKRLAGSRPAIQISRPCRTVFSQHWQALPLASSLACQPRSYSA